MDLERPAPGVVIAHFTGGITLGSSLHACDAQLQKAIREEAAKVVLDMTAVPYMDSAGLGVLVQASGIAKQQGGDLRLYGASARVAELIKMTRTDALLPMDPDLETSLKALG